MKAKSYGINKQQIITDALGRHTEELAVLGYTVVENVLSAKELKTASAKLDALLAIQKKEFSKKELEKINENNLVRCPLAYDSYFLNLTSNEKVLPIVKKMMGDYIVLHLQNGIINQPNLEHHQGSWHRDLPHQDFVISKPLAMSALYCIDNFSAATGGTFLIPFSHRLDSMPSENFVKNHSVQVSAFAGSVLIFDSMLFHKAGYNSSGKVRRGINHVYVAGILKQQINLPEMLGGKYKDDPIYATLLGYESATPKSVIDWRMKRLGKQKK